MLKRNVQLAPYTTFGVGGRARYFVSVSTSVELIEAIGLAKKNRWPYFVIAGGSNVVFGDKTYPGLIIHFKPKATPCRWQGVALTCPANLPLEYLIKTAINNGLAGIETLSGIPGTVGGAIVGNAGAYGQTISDCLTRVKIFDPTVNPRVALKNYPRATLVKWISKDSCHFHYRDSIFKHNDWIVLAVEFKLKRGDKKELLKKSKEIIRLRGEKYLPTLRCPGSFFKNVLVKSLSRTVLAKIDPAKIREGKISAGYLLEQIGAKGMKRGGVRVADFHGNLLINDGGATCREVKLLANTLKRRVHKKFGIRLEEEVQYVV